PLLMFLRPRIDPLLIPPQLTVPHDKFLQSNHYNQIFTTHPLIIIIFMPIPFIFPLCNILLPLQIPPPHLPFPLLNNLTFSLFFPPIILFNLSFIIPPSPPARSTNYAPLPGEF
ncbi:cbb3-type cytochrome c oxidase subunit I, partial [Staphylococcus aureus]|uniref:cbb3-type cytochrome c oxidase subunit I n=1 Tax=Staphylococcus aureus TaxID=1280 RepID=UPI00164268FB